MRAIRLIAFVAIGCGLASIAAADRPRQEDGHGWCAVALSSVTSGRSIGEAEGRLQQAWNMQNAEQLRWEQLDQQIAAENVQQERAARQLRTGTNPARGNDAVLPPTKTPGAESLTSKPAKKPFGAVPGNPTGKRVHRKTRIDDGPIGPTIVRDPRT